MATASFLRGLARSAAGAGRAGSLAPSTRRLLAAVPPPHGTAEAPESDDFDWPPPCNKKPREQRNTNVTRRAASVAEAESVSTETVAVTFANAGADATDAVRVLHTSWLRQNCPSNLEPYSGQKGAMDQSVFAPPCAADALDVTDSGGLRVRWAADGHVSEFSAAWLAEHALPELPALPGLAEMVGGTASRPLVGLGGSDGALSAAAAPAKTLQRLPWADVVGSDEGLLRWLDALRAEAACVVTGAPTEDGTVTRLADAISRPQETIYGTTFDVVSVPEPINIAYSPVELPLHQDLVYYESPPGLQLLHCIDFADDVRGGESTILDAAALLAEFRAEHPSHFATLCAVPALFQKVHYKRAHPVHMTYHRPLVSVNPWGRVTQFTWAPPFEGPLPNYGPEAVGAYYRAYCALAEAIDASPHTVEFRLTPGDILTFNNHRALHGRRAFSALGGTTPRRHLQGVYVNIDDFRSKHEVLRHRLEGRPAAPGAPARRPPIDPQHVWNQDQL